MHLYSAHSHMSNMYAYAQHQLPLSLCTLSLSDTHTNTQCMTPSFSCKTNRGEGRRRGAVKWHVCKLSSALWNQRLCLNSLTCTRRQQLMVDTRMNRVTFKMHGYLFIYNWLYFLSPLQCCYLAVAVPAWCNAVEARVSSGSWT